MILVLSMVRRKPKKTNATSLDIPGFTVHSATAYNHLCSSLQLANQSGFARSRQNYYVISRRVYWWRISLACLTAWRHQATPMATAASGQEVRRHCTWSYRSFAKIYSVRTSYNNARKKRSKNIAIDQQPLSRQTGRSIVARLEIIILRKFPIILFLNSQFICYYSR